MDLLRYSETVLDVCLKDKSKREINDVMRQVYVYPTRIRICPCIQDPWVRKTLGFLNAQFNNEPSHK